jgi:hypothetical protein
LVSVVVSLSALGCTTLSVQNRFSRYFTDSRDCEELTLALNLPLPGT